MAQLETWIRQDLKKPLQVQYLSGTMFSQDNAANLVGVEVFDDGEPATLGGSVSANVVRSDGQTVAVSTGTLSGNKVSVVLPQAVYAIPGQISIIIKLTAGGTVTTLGAIVVTVYRSSTDAVVDPGTIIPSVQNLISQIETAVASIPADYSSLWTSLAPAFSNSTAYTAGQYVTYNGHLYRFTANHAAGSFVNTDCTQVDVGSELSSLKSALSVISGSADVGTDNSYIKNSDLSIVSNNGFAISSVLHINSGNKLLFKATGYATQVCMIAECTSTGDIIRSLARSTGSSESVYSYSFDRDTYIVLCYLKAADHSYMIAPTMSDVDNIKTQLGYVSKICDVKQDGKYIQASNLSVQSVSSFAITDVIEVKHGQRIILTAAGYSTTVSMITECDSAGTPLKCLAKSISSDVENYTYLFENDSYCIISFVKNADHGYIIINETDNGEIKQFIGYLPVQPEIKETGKFIDKNGVIQSSSGFAYSKPIPVESGDNIVVKCAGYASNVSIISACNADQSVITKRVVSSGSSVEEYSYIVQDEEYIAISWHIPSGLEFSQNRAYANASLLKSTENHEERIQSVENVLYNAHNIFSAFKNIMCIGDSLTYGAVYTAQSEARQAYRPYPAVLGTLTGATIHQYATGGYTAKLMWSHFGDNIIQRDGQLVILYAGTNGGLTDTMDTDMIGSDYTQWADTNTGCYGKIIAKAQSVGAKVLLIKVYHSVDASILQTTNEVIDKMATKFSIPVVDAIHLTETIYHYYPDKTGINNIHYNDFGYSEFAHRLYNAVISMSETDLAKILIS